MSEATRVPLTVIAIHGVGSPPPRQFMDEVVQGLAIHGDARYSTNTVVYQNSQSYQASDMTGPAHRWNVREVNWTDIKQFPTSTLGLVLYALKILIAMIQLTQHGWSKDRGVTGPLFFGWLVRVYFATFSFVLPIATLFIAYAYLFRSSPKILVAALILASLAASFALYALHRVEPLALLGIPVLALGLATSFAIVYMADAQGDVATRWAFRAVGVAELLAAPLAIFCLLELLFRFAVFGRRKRENWTHFVTRAGFLILPLALVTGAYGALVNFLGLYGISWLGVNAAPLNELYAKAMLKVGVPIARMEYVNAAATGLVGFSLLFALLCWGLCLLIDPSNRWRVARWFHNWIIYGVLWTMLIGFLLVGAILMVDFACRDPAHQWCTPYNLFADGIVARNNHELRDIYGISSLRIVPFLPLLIGPLRILVNVVADVVFYILSPEHKLALSIQCRARERFRTLFEASASASPIVVAHSQGAMIAYDVLTLDSRLQTACPKFITVGSPIGSLYGRFLNWPIAASPSPLWINGYRHSDLIAGPVFGANIDVEVKYNYPKWHYGYFDEKQIMGHIA